ncbi:hypothetical protein GA0115256_114837 [Streptomyces sp. DconLS]|nr:hypothetical protein GA0115256_114837 [Streptomyces sp. DconLS]
MSQSVRQLRLVWIATLRMCGNRLSSTSARRYQDRTRPSPHGVNSSESRSPSCAAAQSANRSNAARSAVSWARLSRRFANGQYGQS